MQAAQSKTELFKRLPTAEHADERKEIRQKINHRQQRSLFGVTIWKGTPRNAWRDAVISQTTTHLLLCLWRHHALITTLYLLRTSSQKENSEMFVLKCCIQMVAIGKNLATRFALVSGVKLVTKNCIDRFDTSNLQKATCDLVMWVTVFNTVSLDYSKMLRLQEICETPHPRLVECYAYLVRAHLCLFRGCAKSKQQCPTGVPMYKGQ